MKHITLITLSIFAIIFSSCEKYSSDDITSPTEANSTLMLSASLSEASDETEISWPINIYVFDKDNNCIATQLLNDASSMIDIKLPEGLYHVYAVGGATSDKYSLPTKETATPDFVLSLNDDNQHADLMLAKNTITMTSGETNKLTLAMQRKVARLQQITISNVPSDVTDVSVSFAPIYSTICLNGTYNGADNSYKATLTKQSDGTTWSNTDAINIMPSSSSPVTIKISFTTSTEIKSYSYTCAEEIEANYKFNISGTYKENSITLSGTITGATWAGTKNITFTFEDEESSSDDTGNSGSETDDIPTVGSIYKGCYVLKSEISGNSTVVTLMTANEYREGFSGLSGDMTAFRSAVDNAISGLSIEGISGWRLPSLEEIQLVKNDYNNINNTLTSNGLTNLINNKMYLFLDEQDDIKSFSLSNGYSFEAEENSYVRAFTQKTFYN
ncbi:MAG: FimB/Mfa2 family fimbrial subunit [Prevotella sp.]